MLELERLRQWSGQHRGIHFTIKHWGGSFKPKGIWNYYIQLNTKQLPEEYRKIFILEPRYFRFSPESPERLTYDYLELPVDMHGGITFYEVTYSPKGEPLGIELGCDYNHIFDDACIYNEHILACDAVATINDLLERFPKMLMSRPSDGAWVPCPEPQATT